MQLCSFAHERKSDNFPNAVAYSGLGTISPVGSGDRIKLMVRPAGGESMLGIQVGLFECEKREVAGVLKPTRCPPWLEVEAEPHVHLFLKQQSCLNHVGPKEAREIGITRIFDTPTVRELNGKDDHRVPGGDAITR
jgi:hypothetical protein